MLFQVIRFSVGCGIYVLHEIKRFNLPSRYVRLEHEISLKTLKNYEMASQLYGYEHFNRLSY